jgi:hypothetical protein
MSNRPARITQAEIERALRAAKKAGVAEVEVRIGEEASIRIPLVPDELPRDTVASGNSWSDRYGDDQDALR